MQNNTVTEKDEELVCILMEEEDGDNESEGLFCSIRTAMLYKILKLMGRWKMEDFAQSILLFDNLDLLKNLQYERGALQF